MSGQVFDRPVAIIQCRINKIIADKSDFKEAVTIEHTIIKDSVIFSGKVSSLFRAVVRFKKVDVAGDIQMENCIFSRGLIFEDCKVNNLIKLKGLVCEEQFSILNSKIMGIACQSGQFRGKTNISASHFEKTANFQQSSFYKSLNISASNFQRAHFMDIYIKEHMEMARCIFEKSGNFGRIQCDDGISLEGCVCNGNFNMGEAYLKDRISFRRTEFCGDASFSRFLAVGHITMEKVTFASLADFSGAHFAGTELLQTSFYGTANFTEAIFSENLSLHECVFEQKTHFGRAMFLEKVDFRSSEWKDTISLANTIGDYIFINREQVEGKILADQQKDHAIAEQEYLTLKHIFRRQMQPRDEDWAHYHYRKTARKKEKISFLKPMRLVHKFFDWFFGDLGCQYGTRPAGFLGLSIAFILIFGVIYGVFFSAELRLPKDPMWQRWVGALWHSFVSFIPSGMATWKEMAALFPFSKAVLVNIIMVVENLAGWIMLLLFLLSFTRKLLRD